MTGFAERHEIAEVVRAAVGERFDVMDFGCCSVSSFAPAHFAQWISRQKHRADLTPAVTVAALCLRRPAVSIVLLLNQFQVLVAVAGIDISELSTAAVSARAFRFPRHGNHLSVSKNLS